MKENDEVYRGFSDDELKENIDLTERKQTTPVDLYWFKLQQKVLNDLKGRTLLSNVEQEKGFADFKNFDDYLNDVEDLNGGNFNKARQLFQNVARIEGMVDLELGREQVKAETNEKIKNAREKEDMAAYLVWISGSKAVHLKMTFESMKEDMLNRLDNVLTSRGGADIKLNNNPTVQTIFDRLGMTVDEREFFRKKFKVKDNHDVIRYFKDNANVPQTKLPKTASDQEKARAKLITALQMTLYEFYYKKTLENFKNGLMQGERIMFDKGEKLRNQKSLNKTYPDIKTYATKKNLYDENVIKVTNELTGELTSTNSFHLQIREGISDTYENEYFLRVHHLAGAIAELESTGTGNSIDSFLLHRKNSNEYEKMLASMKDFYKAIKERKWGEVLEKRQECVRACYAYLEGKEKKRVHDFGVTRFEVAMSVLEQYDSKNFELQINKVNRVRNAKKGSSDFLRRAKVSQKSTELVKRGKLAEQEKTKGGRTLIKGGGGDDGILIVEGVYSPKPVKKAGLSEENFNKIVKINQQFAPICNDEDKDFLNDKQIKLHNRDFEAVAYAGALTKEAYKKSQIPYSGLTDEQGALWGAHQYTADLVRGGLTQLSDSKHIEAINKGRTLAREALTAYGDGRKTKLANLLQTGIRYVVDRVKAGGMSPEILADIEMAARMKDMLLRDDGLYEEAKKKGLTTQQLRYVESISVASRIYQRARKAEEELKKATNENKSLSREKKLAIATDILTYEQLNCSFNSRNKKALSDSKYLDTFNDLSEKGADARNKEYEEIQKKKKEAKKNNKDVRIGEGKLNGTYKRQTEMLLMQTKLSYPVEEIDKLQQTGYTQKLYKNVKKWVERNWDMDKTSTLGLSNKILLQKEKLKDEGVMEKEEHKKGGVKLGL